MIFQRSDPRTGLLEMPCSPRDGSWIERRATPSPTRYPAFGSTLTQAAKQTSLFSNVAFQKSRFRSWPNCCGPLIQIRALPAARLFKSRPAASGLCATITYSRFTTASLTKQTASVPPWPSYTAKKLPVASVASSMRTLWFFFTDQPCCWSPPLPSSTSSLPASVSFSLPRPKHGQTLWLQSDRHQTVVSSWQGHRIDLLLQEPAIKVLVLLDISFVNLASKLSDQN